MKNKINILGLLFLSFIIISLAGCNLETSNNGKLDGYWKLCVIDDIALGTSEDLSSKSLFWSVQKDLLVVRDNDDASRPEYVFHFNQGEGELTLSNGQKYDKQKGNKTLESFEILYKFGIYTQPITYNIDNLTSSRMTLSTSEKRLVFKKF